MLLEPCGRVLGGQLRGERVDTRSLKPTWPDDAQAMTFALGIGDRHDRVVERALDVSGAVRDVLLLPATGLLPLLGGDALLEVPSGVILLLVAMVRGPCAKGTRIVWSADREP